MYRKIMGNFRANKVVQVLKDNTIYNLPLIKEGANISQISTLENIKYKSISKFNDDYFIACFDSELYIYNSDLIFVEKMELDKNIKQIKNSQIKFINLEDNRCLIVYRRRTGAIACKLLQMIDDEFLLSQEAVIINSNCTSDYIAACKLSNNKVICAYYRDDLNFLSVVNIDNNNIAIKDGMEVTTDVDEKYWKQNLYLTKINDTTFLYTYCWNNKRNAGEVSSEILEVNAQDNIVQSEKKINFYCCFNRNNMVAHAANPVYVKDNIILHCDFDVVNRKALVVLKEIIKKNNEFIIEDIAIINLNSPTTSLDYLFKLQEKNNIFYFSMANKFNSFHIFKLDFNTNNFEFVKKYYCETTQSCNDNLIATLESNKAVIIDNDNNGLYLVKFSDTNGNIIGLAKNKELICIEGLCELENIELEIGKRYYYDNNGTLTLNSENNTFLGYSIDKNKIIIFPSYSQKKSIIKQYNGKVNKNKVVQVLSDNTIKELPLNSGKIVGLHTKNGQVIIQGFAKLENINLSIGNEYYYDIDGALTLNADGNNYLGYAVNIDTLYIPKFLV
ncbi:hypothetical protein FDA77_00825 [Clostridium botulinum]|nr:hypothetical protein [Clostridium botulinum]NFJ88492.1 hypothetical protein [Clostridium botulinum]HDI3121692.1 hypothetical protein [Clostridium botulinum]